MFIYAKDEDHHASMDRGIERFNDGSGFVVTAPLGVDFYTEVLMKRHARSLTLIALHCALVCAERKTGQRSHQA